MARLVALAMVALASLVSDAKAFEYDGNRNESKVGSIRYAQPAGKYYLSTGETLQSVRLIYTIGSSTVPATAAGQVSTNPNSWKTGVGDYDLRTYKVEFVVRRNGQNFKYTTQTFTYGR